MSRCAKGEAQGGAATWQLQRRGVDHGRFYELDDGADADHAPDAWQRGQPIRWAGLLRRACTRDFRAEVSESLAMFERLRDGARWLDECDLRLCEQDEAAGEAFVYTSSTVDRAEEREIERLFINAVDDQDGIIAEDLTARLSWIANDPDDLSLRARFSFGHEATGDWLDLSDERSDAADRLAAAMFPESAAIDAAQLRDRVAEQHGRPVRFTERIVYSNAPGGGAVFHHDADPGQRGVVFAQLAGATAWLALPRDALARALADFDPRQFAAAAEADAALESPSAATRKILDMTPEFTELLCDRGALYVLHPGDVMLLPSPEPAHAAWHSVFALGQRASLAHSYGIFDARAAGTPIED